MSDGHPHLVWAIVKNILSQSGGKAILSLLRFGIAVLIVRYTGVERFGAYSLTLTLLLVADWLVDFAMTDVAVRIACQDASKKASALRTLAVAKLFQVCLSLAALVLIVWAMGYSAEIVRASLIGAVGVAMYAGILVYRALFKIHLTMERDIAAELIGVTASIPLLWALCARDAPLEALVACFTFARFVTLVMVAALGRSMPPLRPQGRALPDAIAMARVAAPLGIAGLLVALYNALDLLMLSTLSDVRAVGLFAAAQRFIFPVLIIIDAVGATLFPVLSLFWNRQDNQFRIALQRGVDFALILAVGAFCLFQTNAGFLLGLLGPEPAEAAPVLRLLALALVVRAATFILAPVLLVTGRQRYALWLTAGALTAKATLLVWLIPTHGAVGAAYAWLATDLLAGLIPALIITRRIVGFPIDLRVVPRIALAAGASIGFTVLIGVSESLLGLALVAMLYPVCILVFRAITISDLSSLADGVGERFRSADPRDDSSE